MNLPTVNIKTLCEEKNKMKLKTVNLGKLPIYFSIAATLVNISLHTTKNKTKNKYTDREQV